MSLEKNVMEVSGFDEKRTACHGLWTKQNKITVAPIK